MTSLSLRSDGRYQPGLLLADNAHAIAYWMWGDRRAQWCESLAHDLELARPLTRYAPHSRQWVAAILCAAAVDAGRNKRPGSWSHALTSIAAATELDRTDVLARHQELVDMGLARPRGVVTPYTSRRAG